MKGRYLIFILMLSLFNKITLQATTTASESMSESLSQAQAILSALKPKTIYSISTPRSCSTAFLRMMYARGDFQIIHEPGVVALKDFRRLKNQNVLPLVEKLEERILQLSAGKNTFVKEEGYAAYHYLRPESNLLKQQDYHIVFLIRNMHHGLMSLYKRMMPTTTEDYLNDLMNYKKLYELFQEFKQKAVNPPLIIFSEDLTANPQKIVMQFCQHVKIPFKEESLSWQPLDKNFSFKKEWNWDFKLTQGSRPWFQDAINSTGFLNNASSYDVDEQGQPTFKEITDLKLRAIYKNVYDANLPYYQLFFDEYSTQETSQ